MPHPNIKSAQSAYRLWQKAPISSESGSRFNTKAFWPNVTKYNIEQSPISGFMPAETGERKWRLQQ
jgi:hypothetical protein